MSRDEFMKEFACCTENERRNDLPRAILDGRPQFLFAVYEATHYRLTASELDSPSKIMNLMVEDMDNHPVSSKEIAQEEYICTVRDEQG